MSKVKNVYIVINHTHLLKGGKWELVEESEFVSKLRPRHHTMAVAIGEYIGRTVEKGASRGVASYEQFEKYVREKFPKQMSELDLAFESLRLPEDPLQITQVEIEDQFGNMREKTVFDM